VLKLSINAHHHLSLDIYGFKVSDRPSTQPVTDYPSELEAMLKNVVIASANPSNQL
jgi:hypothetical protein